MKTIIIVVLILMLGSTINAQDLISAYSYDTTKTLFKEYFIDNRNNWKLGESYDKQSFSDIDNSNLRVNLKYDTSRVSFLKSSYIPKYPKTFKGETGKFINTLKSISPNDDWQYEIWVKKTGGSKACRFFLYFSDEESKERNGIEIFFDDMEFFAGNPKNGFKTIKQPGVIIPDSLNRIIVRKVKDKYYWFINSTLVSKTEYSLMDVETIYFGFRGKGFYEVDRIKFGEIK